MTLSRPKDSIDLDLVNKLGQIFRNEPNGFDSFKRLFKKIFHKNLPNNLNESNFAKLFGSIYTDKRMYQIYGSCCRVTHCKSNHHWKDEHWVLEGIFDGYKIHWDDGNKSIHNITAVDSYEDVYFVNGKIIAFISNKKLYIIVESGKIINSKIWLKFTPQQLEFINVDSEKFVIIPSQSPKQIIKCSDISGRDWDIYKEKTNDRKICYLKMEKDENNIREKVSGKKRPLENAQNPLPKRIRFEGG